MPFCVPSDRAIEKDVKKAITDLESHQKQQGYDIKRAIKSSDFKRTTQDKRNDTTKDKDKSLPKSPQSSTVVLAPQISEDSSIDPISGTSIVEPIAEANNSHLAAAEDAAVSPHYPISTASPISEKHFRDSESDRSINHNDSLKLHRASSLLGHLPSINEGRRVAHPLIHSEPARSSVFQPAASNSRYDDEDTDDFGSSFNSDKKGNRKKSKKKKSTTFDLKANNTELETQLMSRVLDELDIDDIEKRKETKKTTQQHSPKEQTTTEVSEAERSFLDSFHNNMVKSLDRSKPSKSEEPKGGSELQLMSDLLQELGEDITIDAAPITARQSTDIVPPTARGSIEKGNWGAVKRGSVEIQREKPRMKQLDFSKNKDGSNSYSDLLAEFE